MQLTAKDKRLAKMDLQRAIDAATAAINAGDIESMKSAADALTKARRADVIQRWPTRYGSPIERLCASADATLYRIGDAMRAAEAPKPAPSLVQVLAMRRADRGRAMRAQVDDLAARELPVASSTFRKFARGERTFVVETVSEDSDGGLDGFEVWVRASETNLTGRTFANLRRILEGNTVDVAVAAMDERDELVAKIRKLDAAILDMVAAGAVDGRSAGLVRARIAEEFGAG